MAQRMTQFYEFGRFTLDVQECRLLRDGLRVPLKPKVFETLILLVENSGHMMDKDELMKRLWPDTFVEEANLAVNISQLRKVLGEAENGEQYIETIPKRGYRFNAPVSEVMAEPVDLIVRESVRSRIVIEEEESASLRNQRPKIAGNSPRAAYCDRNCWLPDASQTFRARAGKAFQPRRASLPQSQTECRD